MGAGRLGGSDFAARRALERGGRQEAAEGWQTSTQLEQQQGQRLAAGGARGASQGAGSIAERLAAAFGGDQQAALASLPATFAWCRGRPLSIGRCLNGLEVARLLDRIAATRHDSVLDFASTAQRDWQLIDSCIEAHLQHLQQRQQRQQEEEEEVGEGCGGGGKLRRRACLADTLRVDAAAAGALATPPGHVKAWLTAARQHMSEAQVGAILLANPETVSGSPATALAAISWAQRELGVAHAGAFFRRAPRLLTTTDEKLQDNLVSLLGSLQAVGLTAEQALQLVLKQPKLLAVEPERVKSTAAWLLQFFCTPLLLWKALWNSPELLRRSAEQLHGQAGWLREQLGWGSQRVAEFASAFPQPFAIVDLSKPGTAAKLRFLTKVVGVASEEECIARCSSYLKTSLQSMAALYVLFCEHAPQLLLRCDAAGRPKLNWMLVNERTLQRSKLSRQRINDHVLKWPASEEGQRLLSELRAGDTSNWPRPGAIPPEAVAKQQQQQQRRRRGVAAARGSAGAGQAAAAKAT
ncbi:hypothetical protein ABPG75_005112 [Micractinium tetrahymenae]